MGYLNISNHQQRISWLQHAPAFAKKKIKTNREKDSDYTDLTKVSWFWRLEPIENKRGILRDIEADAGIPGSFTELKNWIKEGRYENSIFDNLQYIEDPQLNSEGISPNLHHALDTDGNSTLVDYTQVSFVQDTVTTIFLLPGKTFEQTV